MPNSDCQFETRCIGIRGFKPRILMQHVANELKTSTSLKELPGGCANKKEFVRPSDGEKMQKHIEFLEAHLRAVIQSGVHLTLDHAYLHRNWKAVSHSFKIANKRLIKDIQSSFVINNFRTVLDAHIFRTKFIRVEQNKWILSSKTYRKNWGSQLQSVSWINVNACSLYRQRFHMLMLKHLLTRCASVVVSVL